MARSAALRLIALCGFLFCVVVVPAFFVRRHSRHGPTGRVYRLAFGALRLGWGFVLVALVLSMVVLAIANPLGRHGTP